RVNAYATNSTFSGNTATGGTGGIYSTGSTALTNSLVVGNHADGSLPDDVVARGGLTLSGGNIVGDTFSTDGTAQATGIAAADIFAQVVEVTDSDGTGTGVYAGVLADNGGDIQTLPLLADASNPAIDVGDLPSGVTTDANGNDRAVDQIGIDNGGAVDAGAVEVQTDLSGIGLVVTTTEDVVDATDGVTSLREAILAVNNGLFDTGSTIRFAGDTDLTGDDALLTLTDPSGTNTVYLAADLDELVVTQSLTIDGDLDGDDSPDITISADSASGADDADSRIFTLYDGDTGSTNSLTLNGLTIRDGYATDTGDGRYSSDGGAIYVGESDALTITNSVFTGNGTNNLMDGGAIFTGDSVSLSIAGSTFTANTSDGDGGAVFASNLSSVSIVDSTLTGNSADRDGGAVNGRDGVYLYVSNSIFSQNTTGEEGGAIYHDGIKGGDTEVPGSIVILDSVFTENTAVNDDGGAISVATRTPLTIVGSQFSGNTAGDTGGAVFFDGRTSLTLVNSTISDSLAGRAGGGLFVDLFDSEVSIVNATIVNNAAGEYGGGIQVDNADTISIASSTLSGNSAAQYGGGVSTSEFFTGTLYLTDNIIAGNAVDGVASDLDAGSTSATLSAAGTNILGTAATGFDEDISGSTLILGDGNAFTLEQVFADVTEVDPDGVADSGDEFDAGVLADNGGDVETIALNLSGPAIDAGALVLLPSDAEDLDDDGNTSEFLPLDARGEERTQGTAPDIGAYEASQIFGDDDANDLTGTDGAEIIEALGDDDFVDAGDGDDLVRTGDGVNVVFAGDGDDSVEGGSDEDAVIAGDGNDDIDSGDGDDLIFALSGVNTIDTGTGDDRVYLSDTSNSVEGGEGTDTVNFSLAESSIEFDLGSSTTFSGIENLIGAESFANTLTGDSSDNEITGGSLDDSLSGGAGNDEINGGAGDDTMDGGLGDDIFIVDSEGDLVVEAADDGYDRVRYRAQDTIIAVVRSLDDQITLAVDNEDVIAQTTIHGV
ncbi:MAG: choice-of-anchor Q domain-containing protein, partial [Pseudomonadota bacterium]